MSERMWQVIADVRDKLPRAPNDADTSDIVDALLAAGFGDVAVAKAEALDAFAREVWTDCISDAPPYLTGFDYDRVGDGNNDDIVQDAFEAGTQWQAHATSMGARHLASEYRAEATK